MENLKNYRVYYAVLLSILLVYFTIGNLIISFNLVDLMYFGFILLTVVRILKVKLI